jgi:hypothetical protein
MIDATPLLRAYAQRRLKRLAGQDPIDAQRDLLERLVRRAEATRFGVDHAFKGIRSVADFQHQVPLRRFEEMWEAYWGPSFPRLTDCTWPGTTPYFAVTSGTTTGITKHIPCTDGILAANRRGTLDLVVHHLAQRPTSRLFAGRNFMLGGSTRLVELAPGIWSGDLSGISGKTVPRWARPFYFPPRRLETIEDWEVKIARLAPASLEVPIRAIGGTPSWLSLFLDHLAALHPERPRRLASFYPDLELLVHGGVNFEPYRQAFDAWLDGSGAETREIYAASEGVIAVADRGSGEGLRLIVDQGLFFEFVPVEELGAEAPRRHWLANVEPGVNYAIVVSSCAGLWSYVIGDTVRLIERDPPRLLITGRTSYTLSAFGEHLIGEEIEKAVATAAGLIGTGVADYAVGALYPEEGDAAGRHLFVIEFAAPVAADRVSVFAAELDQRLAAENEDYAVHRAGNFGMKPPMVYPVPSGTFAAWMKSRGKLGGQNKVPRVINDAGLFANLQDFTGFRHR